MFSLEITGIEQLQQTLRAMATRVEQAMVQAIQAEADRILEASRPLVPVDTGLLVSTGLVRTLQDGAEVRYGGNGLAPYAMVVHERTDVNHPIGQHHYLQAALFEATADMPQRLGPVVAQAMR